MSERLVIGTRGSSLAVRQAEEVAGLLATARPALRIELREYNSSGDDRLDMPFTALAADAFTDRIDQAVLSGEVDVAVHSYKDLPYDATPGLIIGAVPVRADPREALVSRTGLALAALPPGAKIGTSSARRTAALAKVRPDCTLLPIRGTVESRVDQVLRGEFDAALLAVAGLARLGLDRHISEIFDPLVLPPAAAQGAIAVQCRASDAGTLALLRRIDDTTLRATVEAERAKEREIEASPLRGKRVLVTRPDAQAEGFCDALEAEGAIPVRLPLHRMEPVRARATPWTEVASYDWIIFTSANGVSFGWASAPADARAALKRHTGIAVVGPATALAARNCGMQVRLVAPTHMAESLADALGDPTHQRILWVRGTEARDVLGPTLRRRGASLDEQIVYRPVPIEADGDLRARLQDIDIVTLTSPSAVRRFVELAGRDAHGRVACIGPVTAAAARDAGLQVQAVADPYTIPGLMQALRSMTARDHD